MGKQAGYCGHAILPNIVKPAAGGGSNLAGAVAKGASLAAATTSTTLEVARGRVRAPSRLSNRHPEQSSGQTNPNRLLSCEKGLSVGSCV